MDFVAFCRLMLNLWRLNLWGSSVLRKRNSVSLAIRCLRCNEISSPPTFRRSYQRQPDAYSPWYLSALRPKSIYYLHFHSKQRITNQWYFSPKCKSSVLQTPGCARCLAVAPDKHSWRLQLEQQQQQQQLQQRRLQLQQQQQQLTTRDCKAFNYRALIASVVVYRRRSLEISDRLLPTTTTTTTSPDFSLPVTG